jgi:hypothetical protein
MNFEEQMQEAMTTTEETVMTLEEEFGMVNEVQEENNGPVKSRSKDQHVQEFIKLLVETHKKIEVLKDQIALYKEHVKDTKKSYVENDWLDKTELKVAEKVHKMLVKDQGDEIDMMVKIREIAGDLVRPTE